MNTSLLRPLAAAIALLFVVAACAGDSGAQWTFAPVAVADGSATEDGGDETVTDVEAGDTAETAGATEPPADVEASPAGSEAPPAEATEPPAAAGESPSDVEAAESAAPMVDTAGAEPRVVRIVADGALRFTTPEGEQLTDIPVTPGETVRFEVENTAGFPHNFYIGEMSQVSVPSGTTDVGIPDWSTGVQTLDWVVPDDISELQFACTVPGHYALMHGTFSIADEAPAAVVVEVEPTEAPASETAAPAVVVQVEPTEAPAAVVVQVEPTEAPAVVVVESMAPDEGTSAADARVIDIVADGALRFLSAEGEQLTDIAVTPGESVLFRVNNTAGFVHNFYIGEESQVSVPSAVTDVGISDWETGVMELEWVVPDDVSALQFACTVPGHYALMKGTFSVSP